MNTTVSLHLTDEMAQRSEYSVLSHNQTLASAANALASREVNKVVVAQEGATLLLYPDGRYTLIASRAGLITSDDRKEVIRIAV